MFPVVAVMTRPGQNHHRVKGWSLRKVTGGAEAIMSAEGYKGDEKAFLHYGASQHVL